MKRSLLYVMLLSLVLPVPDAGAQQVKLRATVQFPVSDPFVGASLVRFKEEVEARSAKAISVEIFDKGQLYKDNQVIGAVSSGAIEMGFVGQNWIALKVPAAGIVEQPFLFNFEALVRAMTRPGGDIRRLLDEAVLASTGMRVLSWQSVGNTVFYAKGKDATEPQGVKNRIVRVSSPASEQFTTLCGGKPTLLSILKIHDGLKDGTIDMAMTGLAALRARTLWKVSDTITRTEHAPVEFLLVINEKVWRSLSPNHQIVVTESALIAEREARERTSQLEASAYDFAREKGMKVLEITPDQVAEWRACSAQALADFMAKNGDLAQRLMAAYAKLRTDPCCVAGPSTAAFTRR